MNGIQHYEQIAVWAKFGELIPSHGYSAHESLQSNTMFPTPLNNKQAYCRSEGTQPTKSGAANKPNDPSLTVLTKRGLFVK